MAALCWRPVAALADVPSRPLLGSGGRAAAGGCGGVLERVRIEQGGARQQADVCERGRRPGGAARSPSVAVPISRTAFDAKWELVRGARASALMSAALAQAGVLAGMTAAQKLDRVNRWVNRTISYQSDTISYGQRDYWATAAESLGERKGDCEDYAILKMQMLRAAGVDPAAMRLTLLRDLAAHADHAYLVVSSDSGEWVLDNLSDRVYAQSEVRDVRPVLSFSENRRWVHAVPNALRLAGS